MLPFGDGDEMDINWKRWERCKKKTLKVPTDLSVKGKSRGSLAKRNRPTQEIGNECHEAIHVVADDIPHSLICV